MRRGSNTRRMEDERYEYRKRVASAAKSLGVFGVDDLARALQVPREEAASMMEWLKSTGSFKAVNV